MSGSNSAQSDLPDADHLRHSTKEYEMILRSLRPPWALALALSAMLVLASCGSGDADKGNAGDPAGSDSGNTADGGHSAAHAEEPDDIPLAEGEQFADVAIAAAYQPKAPAEPGTDDYRCFLLDPKVEEPRFLSGVKVMADQEELVHHAILYKIPGSSTAAAQRADAEAPGEGWTCFSGTGLEPAADRTSDWMAAWAPGTGEQLFPEGTGYPIGSGDKVIMQVHYNLLAGDGSDQSAARLRLAPAGSNLTPLRTELIAGPTELPCRSGRTGPLCDREVALKDLATRFGPEAGLTPDALLQICAAGAEPEPGPTQSCEFPVPRGFTVRGMAGHMHLLGKSIKVELNAGTPQAATLLDIPVWNFDDQGFDALIDPVRVRAGDKLKVTCTHDQGLRDQLPELKGIEERYVMWGEGTSDEMCLGIILASAN
jgi:hypothetical protein